MLHVQFNIAAPDNMDVRIFWLCLTGAHFFMCIKYVDQSSILKFQGLIIYIYFLQVSHTRVPLFVSSLSKVCMVLIASVLNICKSVTDGRCRYKMLIKRLHVSNLYLCATCLNYHMHFSQLPYIAILYMHSRIATHLLREAVGSVLLEQFYA